MRGFCFSNKVDFMADLHRKYVCRSDVALVETNSFGVPFLFLFRFLAAKSNVVTLGMIGKYRNIWNSSRVPPENTS